MSQRSPNAVRQARWRSRQKRDELYADGPVPRVLVEALIDLQWLKPNEAEDKRAIMRAMVASLMTLNNK